jgi:hypothetical protein
VAIDGQQQGPFTQAEVMEKIKSGVLTRDTLIWSQDLVEWTAAEKVAALAALFSHLPPPIPQ